MDSQARTQLRDWVSFPGGDATGHLQLVRLGILGLLLTATMAAKITPPARRNNIVMRILAAVLAGNAVFRSTLEMFRLT